MRQRIARFFFVFLLGTAAMVLGVVTSMTLTPPGRSLLARTVTRILDRIVIGEIKVGLLVDLPRVRVTYRLPNLLAGRVLLSGVELDQPTIQLIKMRNGRMNYEEVLGLKKGPGGGASPLIDFYQVKVTRGTLRIALPWNPQPTYRRRAGQAWPNDRGRLRRASAGHSPLRSQRPVRAPPHHDARPEAVHRGHRFTRDPSERSGRDRDRRHGPGPPAR